jgi:hypothetical protein
VSLPLPESDAAGPTPLHLLELEIDCRLADLWAMVDEFEDRGIEAIAVLMRAAYGQGYEDCLREAEPGRWFRDVGYDVRA